MNPHLNCPIHSTKMVALQSRRRISSPQIYPLGGGNLHAEAVSDDNWKMDLHFHSSQSAKHQTPFYPRGITESFITPAQRLAQLRREQMDGTTLTDHDQWIGSRIMDLTGMELTAAFPRQLSGQRIPFHFLVYGFNESQYKELIKWRENIFELHKYIHDQGLPHSVAHAFYPPERANMTIGHYELLMLLFKVFETRNGSRNALFNNALQQLLDHMTPNHLDEMLQRYRDNRLPGIDIPAVYRVPGFLSETVLHNPWKYGFTGGSDDHAGNHIGQTYTWSDARNLQEFIDHLRDRRTHAGGTSGHQGYLPYAVGSILGRWAQQEGFDPPLAWRRLSAAALNTDILPNEIRYWAHRAHIFYSHLAGKPVDAGNALFKQTVHDIAHADNPDEKINHAINALEVQYRHTVEKLVNLLKQPETLSFASVSDLFNELRRNLSAIPYFYGIKHLFEERPILHHMQQHIGLDQDRPKNIIWYVDGLEMTNGVVEVISQIAKYAEKMNLPLTIVSSGPKGQTYVDMPTNVTILEAVASVSNPVYPEAMAHIPSIYQIMQHLIDRFSRPESVPDEIIISTPFGTGLGALMAAKLTQTPVSGFYHTDFQIMARSILANLSTNCSDKISDDGLSLNTAIPIDPETGSKMIERIFRSFYDQMDRVFIPSTTYGNILTERGYRQPLQLMLHGYNPEDFHYDPAGRQYLLDKGYVNGDEFTFEIMGRMAPEKNWELLASAFRALTRDREFADQPPKLIIIGDGPFRPTAEKLFAGLNVTFTGAVPKSDYQTARLLLSGSHANVFPSTFDTAGLVVLEALACGLRSLVSDIGGPQEYVKDGVNGRVLPANADHWSRISTAEQERYTQLWKDAMAQQVRLYRQDPLAYNTQRENLIAHIQPFQWENIVRALFFDRRI